MSMQYTYKRVGTSKYALDIDSFFIVRDVCNINKLVLVFVESVIVVIVSLR